MSIKEFEWRCMHEFYAKHPIAKEDIEFADKTANVIACIVGGIGAIIAIFNPIVFFESSYDSDFNMFCNVCISMFIYFLAAGMITSIIADIILHFYKASVLEHPKSVIKRAKADGSYLNYPSDYPCSFLYPGETFPFTPEDDEPDEDDEPAPAPVEAQPEQVTITCAQCGQPMLIPVSNGAVKITCPKCGNSFVHTN